RQNIKDADVEVGDERLELQAEDMEGVAPERNDGEADQRRNQHQDRGGGEDEPVRPGRNDVFLEKELQAVGDRLEQAVKPDLHRTHPVLHVPQDLPLEIGQIGDMKKNDPQHRADLNQNDDNF